MKAGVQLFNPVLLHMRFYTDKAFTETGSPPRTSDVPWQCYYTSGLYKVKGNGKVHPRRGHDGPEGELYSSFNHGAR